MYFGIEAERCSNIPAQYKLTEHVQTAYSCRQCERAETSVPMKKSTVPPALLPGSGIVSASLLAQIMHSKYVLALPLYRQEQELRRLGLPVSRQTIGERRKATDSTSGSQVCLEQPGCRNDTGKG